MQYVWLVCLIVLFQLPVQGKDNFKISGHPEFPPLMFKKGDTIAGVFPDIIMETFKSLNITATLEYVGPWARVQKSAEKGDIDAIAGIYKNEVRAKYLDFIMLPLIENKAVVYVKKGNAFKFESWSSLKGRSLGILIGDRYQESFEQFLNSNKKDIKIERVKAINQLFLMLAKGRIDTVIYSNFVGDIVIKESGLSDEIEMLQPEVYSSDFYFAISRKSPLVKDKARIEQQLKLTISKLTLGDLLRKNSEEYLKLHGGKVL
ncbi:substrate-binding periplasmic protein [Bdellovibrio sp. GT3]|uniref:substrate-binding periplasmic protein n=1 Tax=Bdellovibrio sp. GT3 TaxID=3136282 RepID=UPI0030F0BE5C